MPRIPDNILDDILSRVDIVQLVSGYLPLKRAGRNFKTTCPFHHEKTASFMVSPDKQIYHCFGCGESGNAFGFLMRYERMEFIETVEALAKKAGVVLPAAKDPDYNKTSLITQLYRVNELAALFYQNNLKSPQGSSARNYLLERGLSAEAVNAAKIGFASDAWDGLLNYLRSKGAGLTLIEKAGLILPKRSGGYYDRFRGRVIFPIFDIKGRTLGFGGRVLDDNLPKYMNSPETQIYIKGRNLYGFNLSRDSIREKDLAVVVEGYLDFITPYQHGVQNIVASLGTALTPEQARLLKRYTNNVAIVYDADSAGETATLRSLDIFIEEEMEIRVVSLPKGADPDSFVRKEGGASFKEKIGRAKSLFDYKLGVLKSRYNPGEIEGKARISSAMLDTLRKFKSEVLRSEYVRRLAQDLDIREDALITELKKNSETKSYQRVEGVRPKEHPAMNPTEKLLIKLMLQEGHLVNRVKDNIGPEDFQDARSSRIASLIFDFAEQGKNIEARFLMNHLDKEDIAQIISERNFLADDLPVEHKQRLADDCVQRLKQEKAKSRQRNLCEEIKKAQSSGNEEELNKLLEQYNILIKKK